MQQNTPGRARKKGREDYLNASADILCRQAYRMCRSVYGKKDAVADAKNLKDACAALREAAALSGALQKTDREAGEVLRVVFDRETEDCAV